MARKVKPPSIDVSGLSIEDIMDIPFEMLNNLNRRDLAKITSRLSSTANKRIKRLLNTEYKEVSPALESVLNRVKKSGTTAFSVKGKDVNQLRNEFAQVKKFLNLKTSSIKGTKEVEKQTYQRLGIDTKSPEWSVAKRKRFWSLYRKLVRNKGGEEQVNEFYGSDNIQKLLLEKFNWNKKFDDIINEMEKELTNIYEESQIIDDDYNDIFG